MSKLWLFLSFFQTMKAVRCPTDDLSLTNCVVINEKEPNMEE